MDYLTIAALVGALFLVPTAYAGLIGAPWAPTRIASVRKAFEDIGISASDTVVDLGAGDGAILKQAAMRGAHAIGYELSPIMWMIGYLRIWKYSNARIQYGNFFKKQLPPHTTLIFLFLMPKHMETVGKYIASQHITNGALVLSYAFSFKHLQPARIYREKKCAPLYLYEMAALKEHFLI